MGRIILFGMKQKNLLRTLTLTLITCLINISYSQENQNFREISNRKYAKQVHKLQKQFKKNRIKFEKTKDIKFATPEKYWEQEYIATMNPSLKRPTPEVLQPEIQPVG